MGASSLQRLQIANPRLVKLVSATKASRIMTVSWNLVGESFEVEELLSTVFLSLVLVG